MSKSKLSNKEKSKSMSEKERLSRIIGSIKANLKHAKEMGNADSSIYLEDQLREYEAKLAKLQ